ncbi:MAG: hypothetical protein K2X48_08815 [Chitinophagaceae bacterium]|nr:hypothetical protein [Chitinophagaceae bacterium]
MQVQVDIEFDELVKLVKTLPTGKLRQLKAVIDKKAIKNKPKSNLKKLLLNGPIATKRQIDTIEKNRKAINQWRTM